MWIWGADYESTLDPSAPGTVSWVIPSRWRPQSKETVIWIIHIPKSKPFWNMFIWIRSRMDPNNLKPSYIFYSACCLLGIYDDDVWVDCLDEIVYEMKSGLSLIRTKQQQQQQQQIWEKSMESTIHTDRSTSIPCLPLFPFLSHSHAFTSSSSPTPIYRPRL